MVAASVETKEVGMTPEFSEALVAVEDMRATLILSCDEPMRISRDKFLGWLEAFQNLLGFEDPEEEEAKSDG